MTMRNKTLLFLSLSLITALFFLCQPMSKVEAQIADVPYNTYSIGLRGELVHTATAYESTFILNRGFNSPDDIYIDDQDVVYIADTGNGRIFIYNPKTRESRTIGEGILGQPTGVFVDKEYDIYVADAQHNVVYWFKPDGTLVKTYHRPDEPFFGENAPYRPRKVLVGPNKDVYIISESGTNGIIQLNKEGNFLGYFGVNQVKLSFGLLFRRMIMSKEQLEKYADLKPKASYNFAIDHKNIIYTIIQDETVTPIKKLNIEGNNVLTGRLLPEPKYTDIFVDQKGLIYVVSSNEKSLGVISVLDPNGNLIFMFGTKKSDSLKAGQFSNPSGIAVDSKGDIWVVDKTTGIVQVFTKTEFANLVLTAIEYHNNSQYDRSEELFEEVVRQNAMFALAHSSLGKAYARKGEIDKALESYRIANDKIGYSEIFWEVRDRWIANHLFKTLIIILIALSALYAFKRYKHQIKGYDRFEAWVGQVKRTRLYQELHLMKDMLRHPFDVVYDIKFRQAVRIRTALGLYGVFIILNIVSNYYIRGYLFRSVSDIVLAYEILQYSLPLLLLGIGNHLSNSLQSGESYYRDLFIGLIYACAPIFIFKIPLDLLSNVLTYNEYFVYFLGNLIINGWVIFNILLMFKELNNYTAGQLIVNVVLTLFAVFILVMLYLVISVLASQLLTFFKGILQEVLLR